MAEIHKLDAIDLKFNKSGSKPLFILENLKKLLGAYGVKVRFNVIRKDLDIDYPGIETGETNRLNRLFAEIKSLCHTHGMQTDGLGEFLLALGDDDQHNPINEWIDSRPWDGVSRLDAFYNTVDAENNDLKKLLIKRWMIGAVASVTRPEGVSSALVLVFQGQQYLGKTNWFKNLLSGEVRRYAKDGMIVDVKDRDQVYICLSHWLVELGEIQSTFKKADVDALKAFITNDRDILRLPYAKAYSRFPRQTVFFGSVNEQNYLADKTGNRRFATISCKSINHTHGLDMQQIWAEFKVLYENGESWYLDEDEVSQLNHQNLEHEIIDPIEEEILSFYDWDGFMVNSPCEWKSATQILKDISYKSLDRGSCTRAAIIIAKLNYGRRKRTNTERLLAVPLLRGKAADIWTERL